MNDSQLCVDGCHDDVSAECNYHSHVEPTEKYIEVTILVILIIVAASGNLLLWCSVLRTRKLRKPDNYLVLCLSLADFLVAVVNLPFTLDAVLHDHWLYGNTLCVLQGFTNMLTFVASVMSLAAISVNRYITICHWHHYRDVYSPRNTIFICLGVWLLSAILAMPPLLGWGVYDFLPNASFCFSDWSKSVSFTFFMVIICFGGPLSVMAFCYTRIIKECRMSSKKTMSAKKTIKKPKPLTSFSSKVVVGLRKNSDEEPAKTCTTPEVGTSVNPIKTFFTLPAVTEDSEGDCVNESEYNPSVGNMSECSLSFSSSILDTVAQSPNTAEENPVNDKSIARRFSEGDILEESEISKKNQLMLPPHRLFSQGFQKSRDKLCKLGKVLNMHPSEVVKRLRQKRRRERRKQREIRLAKLFLIVVFAFIISWFPYCIVMFWAVFGKNPVPRVADMLALLLGYANSCYNPIIYGALNRNFRDGYKKLLCCCNNRANKIKNLKRRHRPEGFAASDSRPISSMNTQNGRPPSSLMSEGSLAANLKFFNVADVSLPDGNSEIDYSSTFSQ